jgi:murein DD-endopeptidase MepM/ murein hydrolase activator NlpD
MPANTHKKKLRYAIGLVAIIASCYCIAPAAFNIWGHRDKHATPLDNAWTKIPIRAGDSLAKRLQDHQLAAGDLSRLDKQSHRLLSHLKPGKVIEIIPENGHIAWLRYYPNKTSVLLVQKKGSKLIGSIKQIPMAYNLNYKNVSIDRSLFSSASSAGLSQTMINDVEHMFAGSVDLNHALHRGDSLDVLYEEYYLKGSLHHTGHVVAAKLHNNHKDFAAYQYKLPHHPAGFYQANGHSVDPLFLPFPLKFKRISSKFNLHRLDPVTHHIAPHVGVDLAARRGTPIKSIGNGHVTFAGWSRGYGNTVKISYGQHRQSLYGHLSSFKHGLHVGQKVHKGDVVGFVGQTGWATGPHLHFGFYVHRKAVDWLKYKKPVAPSIPHSQRKQFLNYTHELQSQLALYHDVQLAKNNLHVKEGQG